ncbi:MAG TPA: hypothetical protein VGI41_02965 [Candidatus Udaeobacter sp.]
MPHQGDDRLCFAQIVWAETEDIISGDRERRSVLPWLITSMSCASAYGLIIATSALDCGPIMILTPRLSRSLIASSASDGSTCASRTKN